MTLAEFQAERDAQLERERRAMREEKCWLLMSLLAAGGGSMLGWLTGQNIFSQRNAVKNQNEAITRTRTRTRRIP
jgi:hypothetical protein